MTTRTYAFIFLGLPLMLLACDEKTRQASIAAYTKNQEQKNIWQTQGLAEYRVNFNRSCFCTEEARAVYTLHVKDNVITEAYIAANGRPADVGENDLPTIAEAFDKIDELALQGIDELRVTYHNTLGYPTEIVADFSYQMADEELYWYFRDLQ